MSFPVDHEKPLLHNVPDLQLGSPHDVFSFDLHGRFFCRFPCGVIYHGMAGMGTVLHDVPGTLLGIFQCCAAMLTMYRQALHTILPQAAYKRKAQLLINRMDSTEITKKEKCL